MKELDTKVLQGYGEVTGNPANLELVQKIRDYLVGLETTEQRMEAISLLILTTVLPTISRDVKGILDLRLNTEEKKSE